MKLYLSRHGQTDWNRQHLVQGQTDIPLNETGIAQAYQLSAALRDTPIDLALTSPLSRARVTCEIVCSELHIPYEVCDALTEQNFGTFEGVSTRDPIYRREKARFFTRFPHGESFLDVASRIYPFLHELDERFANGHILIIAHNGICRVIHSYFADLSNDEFLNFKLENCQILTYET